MVATQIETTEILRGLPDHARVWIYQANRPFTDRETLVLQSQLNGFAQSWAAHSKELVAAGQVLHQQFVVLAVNEDLNKASGCSIDASVYFLQNIENQYGVQLFERMNFAFLQDDTLQIAPATDFKRLYTEGVISDATLVFDNLVQTVGDMRQSWLKPLSSSWHKRFTR
jgi:hypothetical protein